MDEETKKEWEKSKRIEAERMKAAQAVANDDSERINSAFLDVRSTNLKGYSRDVESLVRSIEKVSGFGLGFAVVGVILRLVAPIIPDQSGVIAKVGSLAGAAMLGAAIISAVVVFACYFYFREKTNFDFKNILVTAAVAFVVALIYVILNFQSIMAEFMI